MGSSSENEDQLSSKSSVESKHEYQKQSIISYTRDFLLSLSDLDICKKLPSGFDASILSEFEDASNSIFDQQRSLGGLSLSNSKRYDYSSLPPNRFESSSNYSRGSSGRWETRSSGSSDKDGDMQSDQESIMQDSGRRFGNNSRRVWQQPEHDGLLGSGAFPRPSGYAAASIPKGRGNDQYQLNRSIEPYQPPRPYKAAPYSRKDGTDSLNDETFGSAECSSQDREEERKRRESFELTRKEQHRALQEKQKQIPDKHKEKLDGDSIALLENSEDNTSIRNKNNKSDDIFVPALPPNDSSRSQSHIQTPASRPLVPPGFASALLEKNLCVQSSVSSLALEDGSAVTEDKGHANGTDTDQEKEDHSAACIYTNMQKNESKSTYVHFEDADEKFEIPSSGAEVFKYPVGSENQSCKMSGLHEANEFWEDDVVNDFSNMKVATDTVDQDHSASILEKLFGSAMTKSFEGSPNFVEHHAAKADGAWSPAVPESSKFARWFLEEEKKPAEDLSSMDLLSLIVNNKKVASQVSSISNDKAVEHIQPSFPFEKNETSQKKLLMFPETTSMVGIPEPYHHSDKQDSSSAVLTCEDLEQSILAGVKESSSSQQHHVQGPVTVVDRSSKEQKADVDDRASQHLLSLLQKGTDLKVSISFPNQEMMGSNDRLSVTDVKASLSLAVADKASAGNSETVNSSEKTLTLEALFGTAFMNELHSVEAPVSVHRGSVGGSIDAHAQQPHGLLFPHANDGLFSSTSSEYQSNKIIHEGNMVPLNHSHEADVHKTPTSVPQFEDSPSEGTKLGDVSFEVGAVEFHLPEEESLINLGDSVNSINSEPSQIGNTSKTGELLSSNTLEEIDDKLLYAILKGEGPMRLPVMDGQPFLRGPYDLVESDPLYHHLHSRPSSQYPPHQMNHTRPLLPQLDHHAYRSHQMNFIGPEGIHHDPHHPFPANVIPHHAFHSAVGSQFDPAANHPMLNHMPIPGNFAPRHPLQGLPRGVPLPYQINHMPGYVPEMNNMHGFPLNHRQPNYGGLGMGMPGSVVAGGGGSYPETLERLIEMELRANSKQTHPAAAGHIPGIFGSELDMGFRYR